jgi:Tfp pilus assembly protein PilO
MVKDMKKTQNIQAPIPVKEPASKKSKEKVRKSKKGRGSKRWWVKDVILAVINIIFLVVTAVLLGMLPQRGTEFKKLRTTYLQASEKSEVEIAKLEVDASSKINDSLAALFPDEAGLVEFAKEIDKLKEEELVTSFSFASEKAVRDQTGQFGVPIVIIIEGSWSQVGDAMQKLQGLPFMLRAVSIDAERVSESNLISFRYGGFLYVDESLAKN